MKTIKVTIKGIAPMLQHAPTLVNPMNPLSVEMKKVTGKRKKTEEDYTEMSRIEFISGAYYNQTDKWHIPANVIEGLCIKSAKQSKLGTLVKQAILVTDNGTFEFKNQGKAPEQLFSHAEHVDMRVVKLTGSASLIRTRPIFPEWKSTFEIHIDTEKMDVETVKEIIVNGGKYCGIGDYKPRYGRFEVESFNIL